MALHNRDRRYVKSLQTFFKLRVRGKLPKYEGRAAFAKWARVYQCDGIGPGDGIIATSEITTRDKLSKFVIIDRQYG